MTKVNCGLHIVGLKNREGEKKGILQQGGTSCAILQAGLRGFVQSVRIFVVSEGENEASHRAEETVLNLQSSALSLSSVFTPRSSVLGPQFSVLSSQSSVLSPESSVLSLQF